MTAPAVLIGHRTRKNDNNVYILGAGFSADAGLPLIANFLNHMRDAADWLADNHRDDERAAVEKVLEFRHSAAAAGYRINVDLDNIEDLFNLAATRPDQSHRRDMQKAIGATLHYAQLYGTSRQIRLRVKQNDDSWPLTEAWRKTSRVSQAGDSNDIVCSIYDYYAALLAGRTSCTDEDRNTVLTFNYDLLLEESLARLGIRFSYGGHGVDCRSQCLPKSGPGVFTILKLHGSLTGMSTNQTEI